MEEIGKLKVLKEERHSNEETANKINKSARAIDNFFKDFEHYGENCRKRVTTRREKRSILREVSNNERMNSFERINQKISTIVRRHLTLN